MSIDMMNIISTDSQTSLVQFKLEHTLRSGNVWKAYLVMEMGTVLSTLFLGAISDPKVQEILCMAYQNDVIDKTNNHLGRPYRSLLLSKHLSGKALKALDDKDELLAWRLLHVCQGLNHKFIDLSNKPYVQD